jgi:class 3 adenylate cyclase
MPMPFRRDRALRDAGGEPSRDCVLATVLFTDIVNSAARASELGDGRWREPMERHDAVLRNAVVSFRARSSRRPVTAYS